MGRLTDFAAGSGSALCGIFNGTAGSETGGNCTMSEKLPESLKRNELKERQEKRLRQLIAEVIPQNPFWTRRFAAAGVKPHDVWTVDDLTRLPLTSKQSL